MTAGYEHRPAQLEMAELVHDAFQSHRHAIVEAGTGTGKNAGVFVAGDLQRAARGDFHGDKIACKNSCTKKDVPFLQKYFAPNLKVAVMKGRSNFLCKAKLHQMADQPMLRGMEEMDSFRQIREWSKLTETGDRASLRF